MGLFLYRVSACLVYTFLTLQIFIIVVVIPWCCDQSRRVHHESFYGQKRRNIGRTYARPSCTFLVVGLKCFLSFLSIETLMIRTYFLVVPCYVNLSFVLSKSEWCNGVVVCMEVRGIVRISFTGDGVRLFIYCLVEDWMFKRRKIPCTNKPREAIKRSSV